MNDQQLVSIRRGAPTSPTSPSAGQAKAGLPPVWQNSVIMITLLGESEYRPTILS